MTRNCDRCKQRFKCYTTNTSNRPEQLQGINFEVAKCCIRCKNSNFKRGKNPEKVEITVFGEDTKFYAPNTYLRVGRCNKHNVAVHQFSVCPNFDPKMYDNLAWDIHHQIEKELEFCTHNYKFPRYCLIDKKHMEYNGNN